LLGFSDPLLSWFRSFLLNRVITVEHLNFKSDCIQFIKNALFSDDPKLVKVINNQRDAIDSQINIVSSLGAQLNGSQVSLNINVCVFV